MAGLATAFGLVALLAACDINDLLSVESPTRVPASSLESPANAALLVNGAVADFECAFGAYVVVGGLMGDELADATQTADRWSIDRRDLQGRDRRYAVNSCAGLGVYTPLQTARVSANNIRRLLEGWTDAQVPNRAMLLTTASAYEAWAMLLLGEGFCSTVFSTVENGQFVYGDTVSRTAALTQAEARFTETITLATALGASGTNLLNMARVGRARARHDLGDMAGARLDASSVPANFVFNVTASAISGRRQNRVWQESNTLGVSATVGPYYRTLNDPRVPVQSLNRSNALGVPLWAQTKYTSAAASIPLATGLEAQLIIAEADRTTNPTNTVAIINTFRAAGNQGPYTGALDPASLLQEIIDQRRRALFLTGTHLGDYIRYQLPFNPAIGTAYPAGGVYGDQRCMPLPDIERQNNPRLDG